MVKAAEYIREIAFYFGRMPEADKCQFRSFVSRGKDSVILRNLIKEVEKIDPCVHGFTTSRLRRPNNRNLLKQVHAFKTALLEFEGSVTTNMNAKGHDNYEGTFMELRKELITAHLMAEKDAYHLSIDAMKEIHSKARKLEVLQVQKDCSDHLTTFFSLSGDAQSVLWWKKENMRLSIEITNEYTLQNEMAFRIDRLPCCAHHRHSDNYPESKIPRSEVRKINWMIDILCFVKGRHLIEARDSLSNFVKLFREVQDNPARFPLHFRASVIKLILEELFRLERFSLLKAFSDQIELLNYLPAYRRLSMINFFVHFHLKLGNLESLSKLIHNSRTNAAFQIFQPFLQKLELVELLCHFMNHSYHEVLRIVNRKGVFNSKCLFADFDIRTLEVMSLYRIGEDNTAFDKLESLRRFLFRHRELRASDYCMAIYKCIRMQILKKDEMKEAVIIVDQGSVYDLRPLISQAIQPAVEFKPYPLSDLVISMAAENPGRFNHTSQSD